MNNILQAKADKVNEIKEKLSKSQGTVLVKYQGLTVEEDTVLRSNLRQEGIDYKVYKNTLTLRAANELDILGLEKYLTGPVAIAFSYEDATSGARILNEFAKKNKKLELKAGLIDGVIVDESGIQKVANIPSKEVLIAKFLGSIKSPINKFAYVLDAVRTQKNVTGNSEE